MSGHIAVFFRDSGNLLEQVEALVPAGGRQPLVLACRPEHAEAIRARRPVRSTAGEELRDVHTRPAAMLAQHRQLACQARSQEDGQKEGPEDGPGTAQDLVLICEPDAGAGRSDWVRAARYEAAAGLWLREEPVTQICCYPATTPEPLRAWIAQAHPVIASADGRVDSSQHVDPGMLLAQLSGVGLDRSPRGRPCLALTSVTIADLTGIRRRVSACLGAVHTLVRVDFVAAVNEVLTNAYLHGRPPLHLRLWAGPERIECRITDHGDGHRDPTAGYLPRGGDRTGAGLWLARQTCDDVDTRHTATTFTVRLATAAKVRPGQRPTGALARAATAWTRAEQAQRRLAGHR